MGFHFPKLVGPPKPKKLREREYWRQKRRKRTGPLLRRMTEEQKAEILAGPEKADYYAAKFGFHRSAVQKLRVKNGQRRRPGPRSDNDSGGGAGLG